MNGREQVGYYGLAPGRSLGSGYQVVEFLGRGWEGDVYKIVEIATGIERAAKLFYPNRNVAGHALQRYARKLDRLRDVPAIIQYHHRGTARVRGRSVEFLVSEYVEGELLTTVLRRQPGKRLPQFEALHLLYALAEAVTPIHLAAEYHGDLHTANIVVRRKGVGFRIKLLDFFDLGRFTRERMADDVFDLISIFYRAIGGAARYRLAGPEIKQVVYGKRRAALRRRFPTAGHLKIGLENLEWS
jgi:aminoglycoside phosphotransferase (APT) family kinase protein